ncbi:CPBP family intramembrane glutamic endopeptidase [Nocardia africana]|nr:CPBP family intramembrane glutamic endopeptidase [Nocardia africana]MCC3313761.1 CPBP family intramembrane metalloprotease [Nocardia africana]
MSLPFFVLGAVVDSVQVGALELPASAMMFLVPMLAAVFLVYRDEGRSAVRALLRSTFDYSAATHKAWYLAAAGLPLVTGGTAYGIARMLGAVDGGVPIALAALPFAVIATWFAATCEELGWTGYATDPLQQRWGPAWTGIALGTYWAAWHLVPLVQVGHEFWWIAGWFAGTVAGRVLIVWLHNVTGHGVPAAILFHTMLNVTAVATPDYDRPVVVIAGGAVLTLAAAVTACSWRRRNQLSMPTPQTSQARSIRLIETGGRDRRRSRRV